MYKLESTLMSPRFTVKPTIEELKVILNNCLDEWLEKAKKENKDDFK